MNTVEIYFDFVSPYSYLALTQVGSFGERHVRRFTDSALAAGVFGVPTFRFGPELFWGHDRLEHLAARLSGAAPPDDADVARLVERPRGADRRVAGLRPVNPDG